MPATLDEMLHALRAAVARGVDVSPLTDAIEALVEDDPQGSRAAAYAYTGDEQMRLWAVGLVGDPRDFDLLAAGLEDPALRFTALEALANQPDAGRVDEVARSFLDDPDPAVRSQAATMVAFRARPGALAVLLPLAEDPVAHVRKVVCYRLGMMRDPAVEPTLRGLLADPDEGVRKSAARSLTTLNSG